MKTSFIIILLSLIIIACDNDESTRNTNIETDPDLELNILPDSFKPIEMNENYNVSSLNSRVHYNNTIVSPVIESFDAGKTKKPNEAGDYEMIAQIENPVVDGISLSATSVEYSETHDRVYVTYHANGYPIAGAIESYDVSNPANPILDAQYTFSNLEFNDIHISVGPVNDRQNNIYTAGNTDLDNNSYYSIFHRFYISPSGYLSMDSEDYDVKYLDYGTASAVMKYNSFVYLASAGTDGMVYPLRKDFSGGYGSRVWDTPQNAVKYLDNYRGKMVILTNGAFYLTDVRNNPAIFATNLYWSKSFASFSPSDGKNVVKIDANNIYIAAGTSGVYQYSYDTSDATLVNHIQSSSYTNMAAGLDADNKYVYIANGWAVTAYKKTEPNTLYHYNLGLGSVNFVKAYKDLLFVAAGTGGLYILNKGELE